MSVRPIYNASAGRGGVPVRGSAPTGYGSNSSLNQGYSPEVLGGSTTVSEVVMVPAALADFAADGKFNEIMLNIKKQTNINHIDRKMEGGVCKHIHISAPSNETGNNARKLVETHFKNRIKLMEREARVDKIQNDLFSAQGEAASGMMVDFIIPTSVIGLVIGKAGQRIKAIEKETGVSSINLDGNTGKVIVVGPDARSVCSPSLSSYLPLLTPFLIFLLFSF